MSLLLPLGLLALLALPVIIVLHLIRERRRRVAVPSLLHWLAAQRPPDNRQRQRLPLTLLLLLQLIVAGLLGLALSRPQFFGLPTGRVQQLAIVIDTSTSMAAREGASTRFAQAQERARALVGEMASGGRATLISAGPTARVVAAADQGNTAVLDVAIANLELGGTGTDMTNALTLAKAAVDTRNSARIVVLTDGATAAPNDGTVDWQLIGSSQPNRAIIAFASRLGSGAVHVYARVANYGASPFSGGLRLYRDDQRIDVRNVDIAAQGEAELTWELPAGNGTLRAELDSGDALPQDDQAFLTIAPARKTNVLLVSAAPQPIQRALGVVPDVQVATVDPSAYAVSTEAGQADLTIFDNFLPPQWPQGAVLAINPTTGSQLLNVTDQSTSIDGFSFTQQGAEMTGLSFGGVRFDTVRQVTAPEWAQVELASGDVPLVLRGRDGAHEIAVWTFDLASTNLPTQLAFPILVSRTVRDLVPSALPSSVQAGSPLTLRPSPRAVQVELSAPDGRTSQVPVGSSVTFDDLLQPGWYRVVERASAGPLFESQLAVNAGAALESDLQPQSSSTTTANESPAGGQSQRSVVDIWPWLALAGLVVLVLEWGYILR